MKNQPKIFQSISELHKAMGQPKPMHPLISVLDYGKAIFEPKDFEQGIILDFYKISFKTNFSGKLRYGHGFYDFEEGGMSFVAPGQILKMQEEEADYSGMSLNIHPDFILHKSNTALSNFKSDYLFNLVYFDAFAPNVQPDLWTKEVFEKMFSLLTGSGILVTYCSKADVRRSMLAAGFQVEKLSGPPHKREMLRAGRGKQY